MQVWIACGLMRAGERAQEVEPVQCDRFKKFSDINLNEEARWYIALQNSARLLSEAGKGVSTSLLKTLDDQ